jgi:hypothetical protein
VAFDFVNPALEIGLSIPGPGASAAQKTWGKHVDVVATQLHDLPGNFEVVFDVGDLARPTKVVSVADIDTPWLAAAASGAVNTSHLRVRSCVDPLSLTVQEAREKVVALKHAMEQCPAVWDMLRSSGHLASHESAI